MVEDWNRKRFHELHTALRAGGISERKLQHPGHQSWIRPSRANTQRLLGCRAGDTYLVAPPS